jgi:mannose PTS system EIIA component
MIGMVVVAHAGLARELLVAGEMIVGGIQAAEAVGVTPDARMEEIRDAIASAIQRVGGDGVIVMTDMFGGTPSNISLSFLDENRIEVLTGVNLPMVIKFATEREKFGVADLAARLKACGRESISVAGDYLK